jgi:hypothetical protein
MADVSASTTACLSYFHLWADGGGSVADPASMRVADAVWYNACRPAYGRCTVVHCSVQVHCLMHWPAGVPQSLQGLLLPNHSWYVSQMLPNERLEVRSCMRCLRMRVV